MSKATLILSSCVFQLESELNFAVPRDARGLRNRPNCGSTQGDTSWFVDAPYSLHLPMTLTEYAAKFNIELHAFNDDEADLVCAKIKVDFTPGQKSPF